MTTQRFIDRQWILKWLLLPFVLVIYWLSPDSHRQGAMVYWWALCYLVYLILLEIISKANNPLYSKPSLQMVRIQAMILFGTTLVILTDGAESRFWFVYLWSLFSAAFHFSRRVTIGAFVESSILYFLASIIAAGTLPSVNVISLVTSLVILLLLTIVFRYLVEIVNEYRSLERQVEYTRVLQEIHQDIDTALDLQDILNRVLERAVKLVNAREGSLMLVQGKELLFSARVGHPLEDNIKKRKFQIGEGIAGKVAETGQPYLCHDTQLDKNFAPILGGTPIRSIASVPIISHNTVLGVINVDSEQVYRFSVSDIQLLATLADQVASTIERAELWDSLRKIGQSTLAGSENLYQEIVDTVNRFTNCPVAIWQIDQADKTQARIRAHIGLRPEYARKRLLKLEGSLVHQAMQTGQEIPIEDIEQSDRVSSASKEEALVQNWKSMLVVPLMATAERAVGALSVYSLTKRTFAPWQVNLIKMLASQAGIAVQNSERLDMIQRLNEIGQSLTTLQGSPQVLKETLERITITAMSALGADLIDLYQYIADQGAFIVPPVRLGERRFPDLVPKEIYRDDVVFKIVQTGANLYVPDAQSHAVLADDREIVHENRDRPRFVIREEILSSAAVIIRVNSEILGVLFASYRQRQDFERQPELKKQLEAFANFAGAAIQNARLLEQEQTLRKQA
ncbi:MAG: GAF domain-containing protein, partial [Anaerolineae bacterium]|nr:GAF domain-containing protein [Anaerolineae bacterium]